MSNPSTMSDAWFWSPVFFNSTAKMRCLCSIHWEKDLKVELTGGDLETVGNMRMINELLWPRIGKVLWGQHELGRGDPKS